MHAELQTLLQQRLEIIANHTLRDQDPDKHLTALKNISEKITAFTNTHISQLDPKLRHYLTNSSYQKALDHITHLAPTQNPL